MSEVASSLSSFVPKPGPQRAWLLQLQIWLLLTEVYLVNDRPDDAKLSLQEATNIFPLSHHIMYTVCWFFYFVNFLLLLLLLLGQKNKKKTCKFTRENNKS